MCRMSSVAQRLRHARHFRAMTADQLDLAAGLPPGTVARIESAARSTKRDADAVRGLAAVLGARAAWLQSGHAGESPNITADNCAETVPHLRVQLNGRLVTLLAAPEMWIEIAVGTHRVGDAVAHLGITSTTSKANPVRGTVWLFPEPENPHDRSAVRVFVGELHAAYMDRGSAGSWQPVVLAFAQRYGAPVGCYAEAFFDGALRLNLCMPVSLPHVIAF